MPPVHSTLKKNVDNPQPPTPRRADCGLNEFARLAPAVRDALRERPRADELVAQVNRFKGDAYNDALVADRLFTIYGAQWFLVDRTTVIRFDWIPIEAAFVNAAIAPDHKTKRIKAREQILYIADVIKFN